MRPVSLWWVNTFRRIGVAWGAVDVRKNFVAGQAVVQMQDVIAAYRGQQLAHSCRALDAAVELRSRASQGKICLLLAAFLVVSRRKHVRGAQGQRRLERGAVVRRI
jgi:hypothetical protein